MPQHPTFHLRPATEADAANLAQVHVQAWREAYAGMIPDAVLAALNPAQRAAMWRDSLARGTVVHLAERFAAGEGAERAVEPGVDPSAGAAVGFVFAPRAVVSGAVGQSLQFHRASRQQL